MAKYLTVLLASTALVTAGQVSFQTHYIPLGQQDSSRAIASDAAGNVFVLSTVSDSTRQVVQVTKTDPQGNLLASFDLIMTGNTLAVDSLGNVFVVGSQEGTKIFRGTATGSTARIYKLDNGLTRIIASATLGNGANGGSGALAVAFDAASNVFVAGSTWDPTFPSTPGAYQTMPPVGNPEGGPPFIATYTFVTKFTADLATVVYSTFVGSPGIDCLSDVCFERFAATSPVGIAVDSVGVVTLAANTNSNLLVGGGPLMFEYGIVGKLSADGSSLFTLTGTENPYATPTWFSAMAVDNGGNVVLVGFGGGAQSGFDPVQFGAGALQPSPAPGPFPGFVVKYDAALQTPLWGTYFGSSLGADALAGVALDFDGNIWVTGISAISALPGLGGSPSQNSAFIAEISADGSSVLDLLLTQSLGGQAIAYTENGTVAVLGGSDSFLLSGAPGQPSLLAVASSADGVSAGTIAPAELISLFGSGIGPAAGLIGQVVNGVYTNSLEGYQVLFNGMPAPLLYAGPNQIDVVSPFSVSGLSSVTITVSGPQGTIEFPTVFVAPTRPQIFVQPDAGLIPHAAAVNQDGTPNSAANPASPGSIVTLFATGLGWALEQRTDGSINLVSPAYAGGLAVTATAGAYSPASLQVPHVGDAIGDVFGLFEIQIQLPAASAALSIQIGGSPVYSFELYF